MGNCVCFIKHLHTLKLAFSFTGANLLQDEISWKEKGIDFGHSKSFTVNLEIFVAL
jgi:hypothetical protein